MKICSSMEKKLKYIHYDQISEVKMLDILV